MDVPFISICLPTLNSALYLPERLASIRAQTFADWELIVADSYSDDGSWETLDRFAGEEERVRLFQVPKEGIYPALNFCVERAVGRYVYFAMSDDSMALDCLEKLMAALEHHPSCDLAHCSLRLEDVSGSMGAEWWRHQSMFAASTGDLVERRHIRHAPFDGLLHLGGETVYVSLTQLLIRRTLFEKIGPFESCWGSSGDFNWELRASLVSNTVHVPDTWATWRLHDAQASASLEYYTPRALARTDAMIAAAISRVANQLNPDVAKMLQTKWCGYAKARRNFLGVLRNKQGRISRFLFLFRAMISGQMPAIEYFYERLLHRPKWPHSFPSKAGYWLRKLDLPALVPLSE